MQSALGAAPGGECTFVTLDTVVTELPGLEVREHGLTELVHVLDRSKETQLPVKTGSDVFQQLLRHWPAVRQRLAASLGAPQTLSAIFAAERPGERDLIDLPDSVLRAIHEEASRK